MENKELETWLAETKAKNLSKDELNTYVFCLCDDKQNIYNQLQGEFAKDKAQILFNQWQKESEFSPKRGDRVLVWDESENEAEEAIFFDKIGKNIIVFGDESEFDDFIVGKRFISDQFKHMKPLPTEQPTETDFKSKVIEFVDSVIKEHERYLESKVGSHFQNTVSQIMNNQAKEILEKIKQLC